MRGLWQRLADPDGGETPIAVLADRMARAHGGGDLSSLMKRCPVDGAALLPGQDLANLIYITLVLDEGLAPATPSATLKVRAQDVWNEGCARGRGSPQSSGKRATSPAPLSDDSPTPTRARTNACL